MKFRNLFLALATALVVSACASVNLTDFRGEKPLLDLAQYFNGTIGGWDMFQDRSGKVITIAPRCLSPASGSVKSPWRSENADGA